MTGLLFLGDTAWPARNAVDIDPVRPSLEGKKVVINLEGPVIDGQGTGWTVNDRYKISLHSDPEVLSILEQIGVVACDLANNHINDYAGGVSATISQLEARGLDYFGTENRPYTGIDLDGRRYILLGACSSLPGRRAFAGDVNPRLFRPRHLISEIRDLKAANPDAFLVSSLHWGYELSVYPEPADREWAHRAIEAGADCVIGHHPHVVQGVEWHRNRLIAYSLGNFLLPQGEFNGRRLRFFTDEVLVQLGVELCGDGVRYHWFRYDKESSSLRLPGAEFDGSDKLRELTPFAGMNAAEYRRWFASVGAKGYLTKRRAGPIYRGYFGLHGVSARANDLYMRNKRLLRKALMKAGLHRPYNW